MKYNILTPSRSPFYGMDPSRNNLSFLAFWSTMQAVIKKLRIFHSKPISISESDPSEFCHDVTSYTRKTNATSIMLINDNLYFTRNGSIKSKRSDN